MKYILTGMMWLLIFAQEGTSIRCFSCSYPETPGCEGPNIDTSLSVECASNVKLCSEVHFKGDTSFTTRRCATFALAHGCTDAKTDSTRLISCACDTDFCNGQSSSQAATPKTSTNAAALVQSVNVMLVAMLHIVRLIFQHIL